MLRAVKFNFNYSKHSAKTILFIGITQVVEFIFCESFKTSTILGFPRILLVQGFSYLVYEFKQKVKFCVLL